MGERGPVPKRSEERRRNNKPETPIESVPVSGPVPIPTADPKWHPTARLIYESLPSSGQAKFYEPSDWSTAYLLAESLSRDLKPQSIGITEDGKVIRACVPLKGASLAAYLKGFAALGVTEGDRRRMGIEIDRKAKKPALTAVTVMDEYRESLGG